MIIRPWNPGNRAGKVILMSAKLFDYKATRQFIEEAVGEYSKTAPTVAAYLNDLYIRLEEDPRTVSVMEIVTITRLRECEIWYAPNMAANFIYHLMDQLGMDTTGHIGY